MEQPQACRPVLVDHLHLEPPSFAENAAMSTEPARRPPHDAAPRAFVWAIWLAMLVALLRLVVRYAHNIPQFEDWLLVPAITGNETDFFRSLWAQNNEHRVPFPRLVLTGVLWLARGDFRAGMFLSIALIGALAAAFISIARRVRGGRTAYADALFPLALMHAGHSENVLWAWQATQVIPTVLPCVVLYCLVADPWLARTRSAFVAGMCTVLLPLSGGNGLVFALPLALWLAYTMLHRARSRSDKVGVLNTAMLLGSLLLTGGLTALYFVGYRRPDWVPPSPGPTAALTVTAQFEAMSIGPVARSSWLLSVGLVLIFVLATLAIAIPAVIRAKGEARQRALAVVFFFLVTLLFAAALGWGRSGVVEMYQRWPTRYALMATPSLLVGVVIWLLFNRKVSSVVTGALASLLFVLLPLNVQHGVWWQDWYRFGVTGIELALRSGTTPAKLISDYSGYLNNLTPPVMTQRMMMLKRAHMGLWNGIANERANRRDRSNLQSKSDASFVNVDVRYTRPDATEVRLVWGVNGWHTTDIAQSDSTRVEKNVMLTPMRQRAGAFVAQIKLPAGATFNYGFLARTGPKRGFQWESARDVVANADTVIARVDSITSAKRRTATTALLQRTISYTAPGAGAVTLAWGVDGWGTVPQALRSGRAQLKDKVMITRMERRGKSFSATVDVPAGSTLNHGYIISDRSGIWDLTIPLWDPKTSAQPVSRSDTIHDRASVTFPNEFRDTAREWRVWLAGAALVGVLWLGFLIMFARPTGRLDA